MLLKIFSFALSLLGALPALLPRSKHRLPFQIKWQKLVCTPAEEHREPKEIVFGCSQAHPMRHEWANRSWVRLGSIPGECTCTGSKEKDEQANNKHPWPGPSETFPAVPSPPLSMHKTQDLLPTAALRIIFWTNGSCSPGGLPVGDTMGCGGK